jgi:hypothetical protein
MQWLLADLDVADAGAIKRMAYFGAVAGAGAHGYVLRVGFMWSGCWWHYAQGWVVLPLCASAKRVRREVLQQVRVHAAERALGGPVPNALWNS